MPFWIFFACVILKVLCMLDESFFYSFVNQILVKFQYFEHFRKILFYSFIHSFIQFGPFLLYISYFEIGHVCDAIVMLHVECLYLFWYGKRRPITILWYQLDISGPWGCTFQDNMGVVRTLFGKWCDKKWLGKMICMPSDGYTDLCSEDNKYEF